MSKCEHDKRFSGVFLLDPVDNGCVACAFERKAAAVEQMQRAGWRACIDHIITPASDCPVCRVEKLEDRLSFWRRRADTRQQKINQLLRDRPG